MPIIPAVGQPATYRGRICPSASAITPTMTILEAPNKGMKAVWVSMSAATGTGIDNLFEDPEYHITVNQTDAQDNFTDPNTGKPVNLNTDQYGPNVAFVLRNATETAIVYTITCSARVWSGSAWVTGQTTANVTVDPHPSTLGKHFFVSQSGGNSANDGYDPNGFNVSGGSYDPATGVLTKTGAFAAYVQATAEAQDSNFLGVKSGTGITTGTYRILQKVSDDAIRIKTGLSAGVVANVATSNGPFKLVTDITTFRTVIGGADLTAWFKIGDTWSLTSSDDANIRSWATGQAFRAYGDKSGSGVWQLNAAATFSQTRILNTGGAGTMYERCGANNAGNVGTTPGVVFGTPAAGDTCILFYRCALTGGDGTHPTINHQSSGASNGFAYIGCAMAGDTGAQPTHAIFCSLLLGGHFASIANTFTGDGHSLILDHHEYVTHTDRATFRWNTYGTAVLRNFCINGNCTGTAGQYTRYWCISDCKLFGTTNGIDFSSSSNNPTTEGRFKDCVVERCDINIGQIGSQGYGFLPNNAESLTVRDSTFRCPAGDITMGDSGIAPVLRAYRNKSYATGTTSPFMSNCDYLASGSSVRDNEVHRAGASARLCVHSWALSGITNVAWLDNKWYAPSDSDPFYDSNASAQKTFAQWVTKTGDTGASADPGFIDPANGSWHGPVMALAGLTDLVEFYTGQTSVATSYSGYLVNVGDAFLAISVIDVTGHVASESLFAPATVYPRDANAVSFALDVSASGVRSAVLMVNTSLFTYTLTTTVSGGTGGYMARRNNNITIPAGPNSVEIFKASNVGGTDGTPFGKARIECQTGSAAAMEYQIVRTGAGFSPDPSSEWAKLQAGQHHDISVPPGCDRTICCYLQINARGAGGTATGGISILEP